MDKIWVPCRNYYRSVRRTLSWESVQAVTSISPEGLPETLLRREAYLTTISTLSPAKTSEVAEQLETSVSTVNRVVSTFEHEGIVERTRDGIVLTPYGRVLEQEVRTFRESITSSPPLRPIFRALGGWSADVNLEWFLDGTITSATTDAPYAPLSRYSDLFFDSTRKLLVGDRFVIPERGVSAACDTLETGVECTCVWSESAVERLITEYPELVEWSTGRENLEAYAAEKVPFDFAIFDDVLLMYGFDPGTGHMNVLVETADPDAVAWGNEVFDTCRSSAETIDVSSS